MSKHVLVTGGAGFIGAHVARAFLEEGWRVSVIDDLSTGRRDAVPPGAILHTLDIRSPLCAELIMMSRFDVICHHAAQIDVRTSVTDPIGDCGINVMGTLNVAEAVRRSGARTRIIFASSGGAIYGEGTHVAAREDAPTRPDSPYGVSKLAAEQYLGYYTRTHGVESVILRYSNVYGPGQGVSGEGGVVSIFSRRLRMRAPLIIFGDGMQTRDFVHVRDVAHANLLAATVELSRTRWSDVCTLNVGTGIETTVLDLAELLSTAAGVAVPYHHFPARVGEVRRSVIHPERALRVLGWQPQVELAAGLTETYEAMAPIADVEATAGAA